MILKASYQNAKVKLFQDSELKIVLREEPFCRECLKEGKNELSSEVDHIIDITEDVSKFMDRDNLQGLCKSCHSKKTFHTKPSFQKQHWTMVNKKWKI